MKRIDHRFHLLAITLVAFALRVICLDFQPLWWDEGYSMFFATRDFGIMLARTAVDIHPPLYYALLQLWIALAGKSDVAVRLLSVAIGVAAVPTMYALTRRLFDSRVALIATLLLAVSPLHVYYSQEVRMYGLVTLLGLVSVLSFVELFETADHRPPIAVAIAYVLATTAALYTQYYAAFIVVFEVIIAFIVSIQNSKLKIQNLWTRITNYDPSTTLRARLRIVNEFAITWLAIGVLYLPWLIYAGPKLYAYVTGKVAHEAYPSLDPLTFLAQHLAAFSIGHPTTWTWLAWGGVVFVGLAFLGMYTGRQGNKETSGHSAYLSSCSLVYLYLLIPLILGYLINLLYPFHPLRVERLLLLAAPAFYLLIAMGIRALWDRRALFGALALSVTLLVSAASLYDFYTVPRYSDDDYRPLIAEMQTLAQPNDIFLAIYPWQMGYLETYYTGAPLTVIEAPSDAWINDRAQMQRDLDTFLVRQPRVWLPALQTLGRILEDALDAYLRPRAYSVLDTWFGTTRLELFAIADDPPRAARPIAFENGVTISDRGVSSEHVVAGQDIVRVLFDWGDNSPRDFNTSLRLVDAKGNLWAQDDREIARGVQRIGLAIPTGTPPGEYALRLATYNANASHHVNDPIARVNVVAPTQPNLAAVPHRAVIDFANGVRFVGYDAGNKPVRPGDPTSITLYWQATHTLTADCAVVLQIQDARGNVFASTQAAPALGIYPATRWQPNELVRDPQTLTLRGDTPDGDYRIVVALVDANNARVKTADGRDSIQVGTVAVKSRPHYFGAPTPLQSFTARFGDTARLIGYDLAYEQRAVQLTLYWQALAPTQTSYTVFVHLLDTNGTMRAQRDQIPGVGTYPTTSWLKGEYLIDVYNVSIPPDAPPGDYRIAIGMYDATTNMRLPAFDANSQPIGDHNELPTRIRVR
jgi:hypothetical protein